MNYEELFAKYPDMGWIENGEPYFSLSTKINPEATYWVDNAGSVYYYNCKTGESHDLHPYLVKDYPTVRILGKNYSVSRLVATNFLYQPEGTTDVHHKDGNKQNNRSTNLIWLTHAAHMALHHGKAVVQLDKYTRKLLGTFESAADAARKTGCYASGIIDCCNHRLATSSGFAWMRSEEYFHTDDIA